MSWFFVPRARPEARLRLFCFPHAGSGAYGFRSWPESLPDWVEVNAIQLPGRESRLKEPPVASLAGLLEQLLDAIPPRLDRPFALFGHSMGALIAFELARALRRELGRMPAHLFVSGRVAPQLAPRHRLMYTEPDDVFVERLRRFNGTADVVLANPDLMRLFLPVLRADFQLNEAYACVPEPPLDCPISVFGGTEDDVAPIDRMADWQLQTRAQYVQRIFTDGHFFVQTCKERLCRAIAEDLQAHLGVEGATMRQLPASDPCHAETF